MQSKPVKLDAYTQELFNKIEQENITVNPVVWQLLNHVLGNRVHAINAILGDLLDTPSWILKAGSGLMIFLYKISGNRAKMYTVKEVIERALGNAYQIRAFLDHLREVTQQKREF
jgi:hypothetical protein